MSVKLILFSPERNELAIREFNKYPEYGHDEAGLSFWVVKWENGTGNGG